MKIKPIDHLRENSLGRTAEQIRVLLLLDRSGSMKGHEDRVITEVGKFLASVRATFPGSQCLLTLVQFAKQAETCALLQPLEKVPLNYKAIDEGTALWDGIAYILRPEKSRHHPPIFCVFATDGEENSSVETTLKQVQAMIQVREEWGNWKFFILNWQGKRSHSACALRVECIDSSIEKMDEGFAQITQRMARELGRLRAPRQLRLEGGR
jgi:hypothetical protein